MYKFPPPKARVIVSKALVVIVPSSADINPVIVRDPMIAQKRTGRFAPSLNMTPGSSPLFSLFATNGNFSRFHPVQLATSEGDLR